MPDDPNKPATDPGTPDPKGPTPAIDPEVIKASVRDVIKEHLDSLNQGGDDSGQPDTPARPQASENPLEAVINPIIEPHLRKIGVVAAAAQDASIFYASHPEALKYRDDIEKAFRTTVEQGAPYSREALWQWYVGKKRVEGVDIYADIEKARTDAARNAQGVEGGARPGDKPQLKDAFAATDEELNKAMEGVSF